MGIELNGMKLSFSVYQDGIWHETELRPAGEGVLAAENGLGRFEMRYRQESAEEIRYSLRFSPCDRGDFFV